MTDDAKPTTLVWKKHPPFLKSFEEVLAKYDSGSLSPEEKFAFEVKNRDDFKCFFCGERSFKSTIHHKFPKRLGGNDSYANCITICRPCHGKLEFLIDASYDDSINKTVRMILKKISLTIRVWRGK